MTGCIYHEADLDGVMSAAIVKKYFKGDIDLLPYNYGKEIPDVNKYDKVFVVDVSFGNRTRFLFDEWKEKGIDVVWIMMYGITTGSSGVMSWRSNTG